jgi:ABC-type sulfate/molybdate transport systems ATPase subunit
VCTHEIIARGERKGGVTLIVSHDFDLLCTFSTRVLLVDDRGVIGFVPTREAGWHPHDVRTAWTLGVENVLPYEVMESLLSKGLPDIEIGHAVGFWGWSAEWNREDKATITVSQSSIRSIRSALSRGTLYTRMEVDIPGVHEPVVLTGKGKPSAGEEHATLGIHAAWSLQA